MEEEQHYTRYRPYKYENYARETPWQQEITRRTIRKLYNTEEACEALFVSVRWPDGVRCLRCHSANIRYLISYRKYECKKCRRMFSLKSQTWLHGSKVPLADLLEVVFEMMECAHGISANELSRKLGMNYDTVWQLCHTMRMAMKWDTERSGKLGGVTEVDETYTGGKAEGWGRGFKKNKILTLGARSRETGGVRFRVVPTDGGRTRQSLHGFIEDSVDPEALAAVYTDDYPGYNGIGKKLDVKHRTVNHRRKQYARGGIHTNGIESMWSTWYRQWVATHHHVSREYAPLYFAELEWRQSHNRTRTKVMDMLSVLLSDPNKCEDDE